jgi:hypothetical protein
LPDSSEWFYRVTVDDVVYLISRNNGTMTYNLHQENAHGLPGEPTLILEKTITSKNTEKA